MNWQHYSEEKDIKTTKNAVISFSGNSWKVLPFVIEPGSSPEDNCLWKNIRACDPYEPQALWLSDRNRGLSLFFKLLYSPVKVNIQERYMQKVKGEK